MHLQGKWLACDENWKWSLLHFSMGKIVTWAKWKKFCTIWRCWDPWNRGRNYQPTNLPTLISKAGFGWSPTPQIPDAFFWCRHVKHEMYWKGASFFQIKHMFWFRLVSKYRAVPYCLAIPIPVLDPHTHFLPKTLNRKRDAPWFFISRAHGVSTQICNRNCWIIELPDSTTSFLRNLKCMHIIYDYVDALK